MQAVGPSAVPCVMLIQKWLKFQILVCEQGRATAVVLLVASWEQAHVLKLEKLKSLIRFEDVFKIGDNCSFFARSVQACQTFAGCRAVIKLLWLEVLECKEIHRHAYIHTYKITACIIIDILIQAS